jgi:hypothetical protein
MGTPAYAYTHAFSRTHSIVFLSDNLRNTLREVVRENGLDPNKLMQDWETIERGIRVWLEEGDLNNIVIEFCMPSPLVPQLIALIGFSSAQRPEQKASRGL